MSRESYPIICPDCRRFVGSAPFRILVTGVCERAEPPDPEQKDGEHGIPGYCQCATCKGFVRWEIVDRRREPRAVPNIQPASDERAAA